MLIQLTMTIYLAAAQTGASGPVETVKHAEHLDAVVRVGPPEAYPPKGIGVSSKNITQATVATTVCRDEKKRPAGTKTYSQSVRPPDSFTGKIKIQLMQSLKLPGKPGDYELDHMISIENSGAPADPNNLWMEPYAGKYGARVKDQVEDEIHRLLCAGKVTLAEDHACLMDDWIACGQRIGVVK